MADFNDIDRLLDGFLNELLSEKELNKLGTFTRSAIIDRTSGLGKDIKGRPFKPYSDRYAEIREARGLPTHIVTLSTFDYDSMLTQIDHEVANDMQSVSIDITNAEKRRIAAYHNELGVGKAGENIREFWGLTDDEGEQIGDILETDAQSILDDLTRGIK